LNEKTFIKINKETFKRLIAFLENHCDIPQMCVEDLMEALIRFYLLTIKFLKKTPKDRGYIIMHILKILNAHYKDGVPIKEVIRWARYFLISKDYVKKTIAYNKAIGNLYEPKKGRIKVTDDSFEA